MAVQHPADLTPILVALVGAFATVAAAALALRQRRADTGEAIPAVIEEWHELAAELKAERNRAVRERDAAEAVAERAIAERDQALIELRACRLHDHGQIT